ncbi:unnamed protein product [Ixodes pacificus]
MAEIRLPQKRYYRQRAHSNPIADHCFTYQPCPDDMDWEEYFPNFPDESKQVEFADIGCGYGGLLVTLSPMFPDTYMVGMEIRVKVSDYVQDRIKALRVQHPGQYGNVACIRTNAMKHLPNFFRKGQVSKDSVYASTLRERGHNTVCLWCVMLNGVHTVEESTERCAGCRQLLQFSPRLRRSRGRGAARGTLTLAISGFYF